MALATQLLTLALLSLAAGAYAHGFVDVVVDAPALDGASAGPSECPQGSERFFTFISGLNNVAPNSTTPQPALSPVKGIATLCVDTGARRGTWELVLCNFGPVLTGGYTQSHVHVGGPSADFPPPLLPLEPATKPGNPLGPPPKLQPPLVFYGCRQSSGAFTEADLVRLPYSPLPTVGAAPTTIDQLAARARAGELYVNVHSVAHPSGEARGNLQAA